MQNIREMNNDPQSRLAEDKYCPEIHFGHALFMFA